MWNLTALDTSTTTNRRSYFHSGIAHQASSTARETALSPPSNFYPHASARHRHAHAPHPVPHHTPHYMPHHTPAPHTPTPHLPSMSHVIPPGPHSSTARKPRNINDPISKPETSSRELRAKLLRAWAAEPGRQHANDKHARLEAAAGPAGPGRASRRRAERSSRRGRLAGGQASRRPEIRRAAAHERTEQTHSHTAAPTATTAQ